MNTDKNNCYNYAMRNYTNTFAQPGRVNNPDAQNKSCSELNQNVLKDIGTQGRAVAPTGRCERNQWKICAFKSPIDYHFYREEPNGNWSHKPGNKIHTHLDGAQRKIKDPFDADRQQYIQNYKDLCGCFCVSTGIKIQ